MYTYGAVLTQPYFRRKLAALIFSTIILASVGAVSRPVSYPGGVTLMSMNDKDKYSFHAHYSPTAKMSIGYKTEFWREKDWQFQGLQFNYLVNRWNKPKEQANLYLKTGAGVAISDYQGFEKESNAAGFIGIAADWETRRHFVSYENRYTNAGDIDRFYTETARVGIAPYIGDYGDIHTWLMLQLEHQPEADDHYTVTPLVRFFKGVHLAELGVSEDGDAMLNYVIRF